MDPQAIVDALAGSQPQLTRLAGAISGDHNSAQALFVPLIGGISGGIAADQPSVQAIATAISRTPRALDAIASAIAADQNLADAIVNAAGAGAPLAVVAVAGQPVPCGTVPTIGDGQARDVRSGYCFPDLNNGCNGSILTNPADPKTGIMLKNYYKRDSLFVNFANTSYRDLATIVDPGNAAFKMQPDDLANPDQNVFNYRNFFLIDPSDESISKYKDLSEHNTVRLRYAVGNCYPRVALDLSSTVGTSPLENKEIDAARKTIGRISFKSSWMICPAFFTYRMLPLIKGYKSCFGYNAGRREKLLECAGIKYPVGGNPNAPDDVYVYTFVDSAGNYVTRNTLINKNIREEKNSFNAGDLPYDNDFFVFPDNFKNTIVCARYPDGILLFSYDGMLTPIPPLGTAVNKSKLNNNGYNLVGYPDGELHAALHRVITNIVDSARVGAYTAGLDAMTITIRGRPAQLNNPRYEYFRELIVGAMAYIEIMRLFHDILDRDNHLGGRNRITRNRRRRHNKSVTRKSKMTRRKGRGKGKARAMSMLKSAKQRFYGGDNQMIQPLFINSDGNGGYDRPNFAPGQT